MKNPNISRTAHTHITSRTAYKITHTYTLSHRRRAAPQSAPLSILYHHQPWPVWDQDRASRLRPPPATPVRPSAAGTCHKSLCAVCQAQPNDAGMSAPERRTQPSDAGCTRVALAHVRASCGSCFSWPPMSRCRRRERQMSEPPPRPIAKASNEPPPPIGKAPPPRPIAAGIRAADPPPGPPDERPPSLPPAPPLRPFRPRSHSTPWKAPPKSPQTPPWKSPPKSIPWKAFPGSVPCKGPPAATCKLPPPGQPGIGELPLFD